jgi:hypothetical protein
MMQSDCYYHIQFSASFSATPETPLPSPPQGSGQEPYKITANQASVISHQSLSKQKQLWDGASFWIALHKCETHLSSNISRWYFCLLQARLLHGAVIRFYPVFLFVNTFCLLLLWSKAFICFIFLCIFGFEVYCFQLFLHCAWTTYIWLPCFHNINLNL